MVTERVIASRPSSPIGGRLVPTPFEFQSTGEDNLRIEAWCSVAGVTLGVQGRWQQEGRAIDAFVHTLPLVGNRARNVLDVPLALGYVLNMTVVALTGAPKIGQTFVRISLIRGSAPAAIVLATLLQGYVTAVQGLGWPGSPVENSTSQEPLPRAILGSAPALGAVIQETVPTGARWELLSWRFTLTTSAVVADRKALLSFIVNGITIGEVINFSTIPASTIARMTFQANLQSSSDPIDNIHQGGYGSRIILPAGAVITQNAFNLLAGDQFSAPSYLVREWLEVDS